MAVALARPCANNWHLTPDSHTTTSSLSFFGPGALPEAQPTVSKHLRHFLMTTVDIKKGIRPVKNLSDRVLAWSSVWSKVQICIWPS